MTQDLNLTTIAALPGSGAGHVAAMRPECSRPRYPTPDGRKFSERMGIVDGKLPPETKAAIEQASAARALALACPRCHGQGTGSCHVCTPKAYFIRDDGQQFACAHQHDPASFALSPEGAAAMERARTDPPGAVPASADNPLGLRSVAEAWHRQRIRELPAPDPKEAHGLA